MLWFRLAATGCLVGVLGRDMERGIPRSFPNPSFNTFNNWDSDDDAASEDDATYLGNWSQRELDRPRQGLISLSS